MIPLNRWSLTINFEALITKATNFHWLNNVFSSCLVHVSNLGRSFLWDRTCPETDWPRFGRRIILI